MMENSAQASYVEESISLPELFSLTAEKFADHPAIVFQGRKTDFRTFHKLSGNVAASLAARGIRKGDRVGLYCPNSDAFALAYCGIVKAGAAVVPIHLLLNPKEVAYVLKDSEAKALLYSERYSTEVGFVREAALSLSFLVHMGASRPSGDDLWWGDLLGRDAEPPRVDFHPAEDIAAILYTSGTTGQPKGAMLTHRNLIANTHSIQKALCLEPGRDILLVVLPMFHSFAATVGMLFPLLRGCTLVPLPRFDPQVVADEIAATHATIFLGVPSMYSVFLRLPEESVPKLGSLRFCVSGAAALPVEVLKAFEARFGKLIYEGDGPTECSPVTCVNPIGGRRKIGSVGLPIPFVEMRIMDDDGKELPCGAVGEICVRGPNVMKGYWKRPEETRESFFDEWFRTGDLGTRDEDGYFFIVDRKKDMIIVNGMNVYPRVVEEVLYRFPGVKEAAVVGEPHRVHGEIPVAFVALEEGSGSTAEDLRKFCLEHLGRHEVPRKFELVSELPRNAAGKILKRELRKHGEHERGITGTES